MTASTMKLTYKQNMVSYCDIILLNFLRDLTDSDSECKFDGIQHFF